MLLLNLLCSTPPPPPRHQIVFVIWWLRRREHRRREAERDAEAAAAEAPTYVEMGPVIRGEDHRSVANRAAAEEDERLRQAIQVLHRVATPYRTYEHHPLTWCPTALSRLMRPH